jgi:hypothetical protein
MKIGGLPGHGAVRTDGIFPGAGYTASPHPRECLLIVARCEYQPFLYSLVFLFVLNARDLSGKIVRVPRPRLSVPGC